jgi:hypothetical protein
LLEAHPKALVWVVATKHEANALIDRGQIATTNEGDFCEWSDEDSEALAERDVLVLPKNDGHGRTDGYKVVCSAVRFAKSARRVDLLGLRHGGDVCDYFAAGHKVDDLLAKALKEDPAGVTRAEPDPVGQGPAPADGAAGALAADALAASCNGAHPDTPRPRVARGDDQRAEPGQANPDDSPADPVVETHATISSGHTSEPIRAEPVAPVESEREILFGLSCVGQTRVDPKPAPSEAATISEAVDAGAASATAPDGERSLDDPDAPRVDVPQTEPEPAPAGAAPADGRSGEERPSPGRPDGLDQLPTFKSSAVDTAEAAGAPGPYSESQLDELATWVSQQLGELHVLAANALERHRVIGTALNKVRPQFNNRTWNKFLAKCGLDGRRRLFASECMQVAREWPQIQEAFRHSGAAMSLPNVRKFMAKVEGARPQERNGDKDDNAPSDLDLAHRGYIDACKELVARHPEIDGRIGELDVPRLRELMQATKEAAVVSRTFYRKLEWWACEQGLERELRSEGGVVSNA